MTDPRFGLADEDFWSDPYRTRNDLDDRLGLGLFAGAPAFVAIDARETLPVLAYHAATLADARNAQLAQHAVACAVDRTTGAVHAGKIVVRDRALPLGARGAAGAGGAVPRGSTSELRVFDLRARARIPWYPTTLVVRLVMKGAISPPVSVELGRGPSTHDDPEVRRLLEEARRRVPGVSIEPAPGDPLPSYAASDRSPPVPRAGLALAARGGVVHGSFRLVARRADVLPVTPSADARRATAVLPISLLFTGDSDPVVFPMGVPSFDVVAMGNETPEVTGHFAVRVDPDAIPALAPGGSHFVRALAGEHVSDAVVVQV